MEDTFFSALILIPTFFALRLMAKSDTWYTLYARLLFGLSLSGPLTLGLLRVRALDEFGQFPGVSPVPQPVPGPPPQAERQRGRPAQGQRHAKQRGRIPEPIGGEKQQVG